MNPLKYRLPKLEQTDASILQPQPAAIGAWIDAHPTINAQATAPLLLTLLQNYNRCTLLPATRLKTTITLQPAIDDVIRQLRNYYQNESLPLRKNARTQADLASQLLDETACAYKLVIADSVSADSNMSINLMVAALRLTIDQLGQQLLECYSQYTPPVPGLWGELHRTYQLAERNGLHTRVLANDASAVNAPGEDPGKPVATIQHGYLRAALLALTVPNHLMPGQAVLIYGYLQKWAAGCRILNKKVTVVDTGDILIDLAGERPPAIATGHSRFRPVDGRFLDISKLQEKLDTISVNTAQAPQRQPQFTIAERLQRDLLTRIRAAWQGRAKRTDQRKTDMSVQLPICIGLDACHHFICGQSDFRPEQDEAQYLRPQTANGGLTLTPTSDSLELESSGSTTQLGLDNTRLSRFSGKVDVWDTVHETELHTRDKREAAMAHFQVEPWLCINQSADGMALRRLSEAQSRTRVGAMVAFRNSENTGPWKMGALRWLQNNPAQDFDIGIEILADEITPVAVRAIGGTGTGGEYFRSLLIPSLLQRNNELADSSFEITPRILMVPASIYDIGTQLVLNQQTTLEYVRLTKMLETTSSFSMFEFKHIEVPPAEQAKISAIQENQ